MTLGELTRLIEKEDGFLNRPEVLALGRALVGGCQHRLSGHRRALEYGLQGGREVVKGGGLSLEVSPDGELSDGGYSSMGEFRDRETLPHRYRNGEEWV